MDTRAHYANAGSGNFFNGYNGDRSIPTLKRSLSMAEAMSQHQKPEKPLPIATKVRNEAREYLKHNQTCQWIKFMQNPDPSPTSPVARPPNGPETLSDSIAESKDTFYEEQLKEILKRQEDLIARQERLEDELRQQREWQEHQIEQMQSRCLQTKPSSPPAPEEIWPPISETAAPTKGGTPLFRRRLKGNVAQFCAQRNEGCLNNMLYCNDQSNHRCDMTPRSRLQHFQNTNVTKEATTLDKTIRQQSLSPSRTTTPGAHVKGLSPASVGRRHAMAQESGHAVSNLITNTQTSDNRFAYTT